MCTLPAELWEHILGFVIAGPPCALFSPWRLRRQFVFAVRAVCRTWRDLLPGLLLRDGETPEEVLALLGGARGNAFLAERIRRANAAHPYGFLCCDTHRFFSRIIRFAARGGNHAFITHVLSCPETWPPWDQGRGGLPPQDYLREVLRGGAEGGYEALVRQGACGLERGDDADPANKSGHHFRYLDPSLREAATNALAAGQVGSALLCRRLYSEMTPDKEGTDWEAEWQMCRNSVFEAIQSASAQGYTGALQVYLKWGGVQAPGAFVAAAGAGQMGALCLIHNQWGLPAGKECHDFAKAMTACSREEILRRHAQSPSIPIMEWGYAAVAKAFTERCREDVLRQCSRWGLPLDFFDKTLVCAASSGRLELVRLCHELGGTDLLWAAQEALHERQPDAAQLCIDLAESDRAKLDRALYGVD